MFSPLARGMARAKKHLVPMIEERLKVEEEYGKDWEGRPVCGSYFEQFLRRFNG
jgi:hypothetical protein